MMSNGKVAGVLVFLNNYSKSKKWIHLRTNKNFEPNIPSKGKMQISK